MSQSTRIFGAHIAGISIGGTSYLAVCKSGTLTYTNNTQEAVALKDTWKYPIGIRAEWKYTGVFYISTAATSGEGGPGATQWAKAISNTQVAFSQADNAISGGIGTASGSGLIVECTQELGDDAQTVSITIMGQGALAHATS